jgi:hypothetical protein
MPKRNNLGFYKWVNQPSICYFPLVAILLAILPSACLSAPLVTPSPTGTVVILPTLTATFNPSTTSTPSPTPEPAWYEPLDQAYGILKYKYALVTNPKARIYISLQDAIAKTGNFGPPPNYPAYVAYTATETEAGNTWYQVRYGWMAEADLQLLTPSNFTGIQLTRPVPFRFGWVLNDTQSVNGAGLPIQTFHRYQVIHEFQAGKELPGFIAIGGDEWLPADKVALVSPQIPADVDPGTCRFIYTDLSTQVLSVFDQCKLVFATLVSSGRNSWTFEGRFAILYKNPPYSSIVPPATSTSDYYIEGVPYFMSYADNFGFHGAFWHDSFGTPASHGCINLSPADAKWLYDWANLGDVVVISAGK